MLIRGNAKRENYVRKKTCEKRQGILMIDCGIKIGPDVRLDKPWL